MVNSSPIVAHLHMYYMFIDIYIMQSVYWIIDYDRVLLCTTVSTCDRNVNYTHANLCIANRKYIFMFFVLFFFFRKEREIEQKLLIKI